MPGDSDVPDLVAASSLDGTEEFYAVQGGTDVRVSGTQVQTFSAKHPAVVFASAVASPSEGTLQAFTDSTTVVWGAIITGGSTNHVLGYYNGTNWTVAAK